MTALPLLRLGITAGPVELRDVTDDLLGPLAELAIEGIHDPGFMPFLVPWSITPAPDLPRAVAQYHWGHRAGFSAEKRSADFAVFLNGDLVGSQGFGTRDYLHCRAGETGCWLGLRFQRMDQRATLRRVILEPAGLVRASAHG